MLYSAQAFLNVLRFVASCAYFHGLSLVLFYFLNADFSREDWPDFSQSFSSDQTFSELRTHGLKKTSIVCEICHKTFASRRVLAGHINSKHLKSKPYVCPFCLKGFSYKTSMDHHKKTCLRGFSLVQ